jgi:membrane protein DedA with SNARE-associated domain
LATIFSRFVLGTRTALLVASGLLKYPVGKFLAVTFAGAAGWLLFIYSLFNFFGLATTFVFGLRWIAALAVVLFGGATAAVINARSRKKPLSGHRTTR